MKLPQPDCDFSVLLKFAGKYNAYEHWADDPNILSDMLGPILREWESTAAIPA